ncbi:helix-turn-helix domain-containing protein [Embleya scabrispora]|nr:helix-turn-helix transcriptional regulator [Embleya scabrispora]
MTATASRAVGLNTRALRKQVGWTMQQLADRCTEHGLAVHRATISKIERGMSDGAPVHVSADQLAVLAAVFGVTADSLLAAADCPTCTGTPPAGMTCNTCGTRTPATHTREPQR